MSHLEFLPPEQKHLLFPSLVTTISDYCGPVTKDGMLHTLLMRVNILK